MVDEKLPHVLPLQPGPVADQLTPAASFVVGVTDKVCPTERPVRFGETETVIGAGGSGSRLPGSTVLLDELPPQPIIALAESKRARPGKESNSWAR